MKKVVNILYLYAEVMPYTEAVILELVNTFQCNVTVIEATKFKQTPFIANKDNFYKYKTKETFLTYNALKRYCIDFDPTIIYISGWMDKNYMSIGSFFKKSGIPVVAGIDAQWKGTTRQYIASVFSKILIQPFFTHIWVAGLRQYEYAKKLGFKNNQIIDCLLSADTRTFQRSKEYPKNKNILFVGTLNKNKRVTLLVKLFIEILEEYNLFDWTLTIIGNGNESLPNHKNIFVKPFLSSETLMKEADKSLIFCLPSYSEAWGLVIHEFSCMGLALLISDSCGSSTTFLINGYNGFIFERDNEKCFKSKLLYLMQKQIEELVFMGEKSIKLSQRITPEISAANLLSILE
ncbi:MAG: glycosyltransferase family 4 protein [Saprospiraceae bacterium]